VFSGGVLLLVKSIPLTPALSPRGERGKGADLRGFQSLSSTQDFQVGVPRQSNTVSPFSPLWERGKGADLHGFQSLSSTQSFQVDVPRQNNGQFFFFRVREREREPISVSFKA
jgi:hypothetical protein